MTKVEHKSFLDIKWLNHTKIYKSDAKRIEFYGAECEEPSDFFNKIGEFIWSYYNTDFFVYSHSEWFLYGLDLEILYEETSKSDFIKRVQAHLDMLNFLHSNELTKSFKGFLRYNSFEDFSEDFRESLVYGLFVYPPHLINKSFDFMFYFHQTKSIGVYYLDTGMNNELIKNLKCMPYIGEVVEY